MAIALSFSHHCWHRWGSEHTCRLCYLRQGASDSNSTALKRKSARTRSTPAPCRELQVAHMHGRGRAAGLRRAADKRMYMRMRAARWADVGRMSGSDDLNHAAPWGALVRLHVHTVC